MANNKVSKLLNISFPEPKRSNFNLGRVNRFTCDPGLVIPCYVEEILPNSYKRLDLESLVQTNATIAPLMGTFKVKFDAFFVPLRLYHKHLDLNTTRPGFSSDFEFHYINTLSADSNVYLANYAYQLAGDSGNRYSNIMVAPGSLIDYLGILPAHHNCASFQNSRKVNAEPLIGYYDIWRNFYSNPHDRLVPYKVQNVSVSWSNPDLVNPGVPIDESYGLNYDYFSLEDLDVFISSIYDKSVVDQYNYSSGVVPSSVNVFSEFINSVGSKTFRDLNPSDKNTTGIPLFANQSVKLRLAVNNEVLYASTQNGLNYGLLPCTYSDDYFNSRFMNEFVTYLENTSRVTVSNNQFTISQLRIANRVAKYVDKTVFSDSRFGTWLKAHFGVKTNNKLNIPQFLGSISSNLIFNDIYSSAQTGDGGVTTNQALGSRASLGQSYISNKGSFVEFKASEPGYLMVMFRMIPIVSYFQGIKKMYLKTSFNDIFKPEYDAIGYQDLQKLELNAVVRSMPSNSSVLITQSGAMPSITAYNTSIGKQPAWLEYMTAYDESHGLMTNAYEYGYWVLNRAYDFGDYLGVYEPSSSGTSHVAPSGQTYYSVFSGPSIDFNSTTYIIPDFYNQIFSVNRYTHNFQVQVRFYDKTKQPISKQILPHL